MNKMSIKTAIQLNTILSFLPKDRKEKIPENVWNEITDKADNSDDAKINEIQDIKEENILPETRKYLSFIFLNYLSTEEEKEEYTKILKNNEKTYQNFLNEKYNPDDIFKNKESIEENIDNSNLPVDISKEKFYIKFINFLKKLISFKK